MSHKFFNSGLSEDMVDLLFGNVKEILLFELIFQNDLEEAKEMIRQDSSFHVGVVFVEKALVRGGNSNIVGFVKYRHLYWDKFCQLFWSARLLIRLLCRRARTMFCFDA